MEDVLYNLNPWWSKNYTTKFINREIYIDKIKKNLENKEIIFLTGLRRVGKTSLIYLTIDYLLNKKKVNPKNILFINLDTFEFLENSIHEIIEEYRRIFKKKRDDFFYLFLDEVTSKKDFEIELKSLYDNDNVKIITTSSISTYMRERKAYLTGRTITIEVLPLNFKEFLKFKNIKYTPADKNLLEGYFKEYMREGGIPKYVLDKNDDYLKELIESILYKDIISHYKITNDKIIKELFKLLCYRIGKPTSYNKLASVLKISVDTVKRYITYFENSYLFYSIEKYSHSYNENITSPKKFYIGDVGLKNIVTGFKDLGAIFENLIFLEIKNLNPKYFIENGIEIDFITDNLLIESKFGQKLTEKQKKIFNKIKKKNKLIIEDYKFFLNN